MKKICLVLMTLLSCSLSAGAQGFMLHRDTESSEWVNVHDGISATFQKGKDGIYELNFHHIGDYGNKNSSSFGVAITDGASIEFHPSALLGNYSNKKVITCQPSGDIIEIPVLGKSDVQITFENLPSYIHQLEDEVRDGRSYIRLSVEANAANEVRETVISASINGYGTKFYFVQLGCEEPSFAEQKEALKELYNSTQGPYWKDNTNWLSDKPIHQWHGVNNTIYGDTIIGNYVLELQLGYNNLNGKIPSGLSKLMSPSRISELRDDFGYVGFNFVLNDNFLQGKIPQTVKNHPNWNKLGWDVINQNNWCPYSGFFEWNDFNLKTEDGEVSYFLEDKTARVKDILQNNEYTLIFFAGLNSDDLTWWYGISNKRINLYLDYCNKGLGMVGIVDNVYGYTGSAISDYLNERLVAGMPQSILWVKDQFGSINPGLLGTAYLLDKEGNLVQIWNGNCDYDYCLNDISNYLHEKLGEPEEHVAFTANYYESSDYKKDGEVVTLQEASVGNGVDLVFLGECFVDTDMDPDGLYEQTMREAMEQFFAEEPYKSLRDRFNVYAVKAVSPNGVYDVGTKLALGGDNEKAFEYAKKAVGDKNNGLMVNIICKPGSVSGRSRTFMFVEDGSYVAWMLEGVSNVINHEGGGHGVAFLYDEYVEIGLEGSKPSDEELSRLDEEFQKYGVGANVDYHSDPSEVKWAKFIADPRYSAEIIDLYEGAWCYGVGTYRPTVNSMMRHNDCGFNAPSREAIYKKVMKLSEGDDWEYDYETFVEFDTPAREAYKRAKSRGNTHIDAKGQEEKDGHMRRIESRPPIIYKGTWRDAGKCEKAEFSFKQD